MRLRWTGGGKRSQCPEGGGYEKHSGDGGGHGAGKALAAFIAHVLSLQQECLQLDRLKTQLSDAIQRYGVVQKVRPPRGWWWTSWVGLGPMGSHSGLA